MIVYTSRGAYNVLGNIMSDYKVGGTVISHYILWRGFIYLAKDYEQSSTLEIERGQNAKTIKTPITLGGGTRNFPIAGVEPRT